LCKDIRAAEHRAEVERRKYDQALALASSDRARAMTILAECIKDEPEWDLPYIKQAELLLEKKELNKSLEMANKACSLNPDSSAAKYQRGRVWVELKQPPYALQDFQDCVKLDPHNDEAFRYLIKTHVFMDHYKESIALITERINEYPKTADYRLYLQRANYLLHLRRGDSAIPDYDKALSINPRCTEAIGYRGCAYRNVEEPEKALRDLETAIKMGDKNPDFFVALGDTYIDLHQPEKALTAFSEGISAQPTADLYQKRSRLYEFAEKKPDLAMRDLDNAVKLDRNAFELFLRRAALRIDAGRLQDALADCNYVISRKNRMAGAYVQRAEIYKRLGKPNLAQQDVKKAREIGAKEEQRW
jgi:tetratricopeptide (TPR) repeat protein